MFRKISKEEKVEIVKKIHSGSTTVEEQGKALHVCTTKIYHWCAVYEYHGADGLLKKGKNQLSPAKKEEIIREYESGSIPLHRITARELVSMAAFMRWLKSVREHGYAVLSETKTRGRPPKDKFMVRPKKKAPETEIEKLRYENERLRAENLLLKKVKALVEEREARNKAIGQKPSRS